MFNGDLYSIGLDDLPDKPSEEYIRNLVWGAALVLGRLGKGERLRFLNYLLDHLAKASLYTQCFGLDTLLNFIDELLEDGQCKLLETYMGLSQCTYCTNCCKRTINICGIFGRVWNRVSVKAQNLIVEYVKSYNPAPGEESEYSQVLELLASADKKLSVKEFFTGIRNNGDMPIIALIIPEFLSASSFLQPPVDMLMSAAQLMKAGYGVIILDNRVKHLSISGVVKEVGRADIIVVTTTPYDHIQNYFLDYRLKYTFDTINALKNEYPQKKVVVCGAHGTVRPDIVFRDTLADIIIRWDYDYHILRLVNAICSQEDLRHIPNVRIRGDNSIVDENPLNPVNNYTQANLNDGVLPAYDLIDFDNYYGDIYYDNRLNRQCRWGIILASRGCKHNCMFCFNFWGRNIAYRDPLNVVEEMEYLQKEKNVNDIMFIDFHFTQDKEWVSKFCELVIKKGVTTKWSAQVRCDSVSYDLLKQMAAAHCRSLWFGVESFDSCIVRSVHKYKSSDVAVQALNDCKKVGIMPHQFIMIGLPGETRDTINKTIEYVHKLKIPYTESILIATPRYGTEYYNLAQKQFPELGEDFYSLYSLRGIVANELKPTDLQEVITIFRNRNFIYQEKAPRLYETKSNLESNCSICKIL